MRLLLSFVLASGFAYSLPLSFEVNQGQFGPQVKFVSRGSGYTLALTPTGAALAFPQNTVRMEFAGASSAASMTGLQALPARSNYLIGKDPKAWRVGIPLFERVRYAGVYPGIDVIYYGNERELEYDITV